MEAFQNCHVRRCGLVWRSTHEPRCKTVWHSPSELADGLVLLRYGGSLLYKWSHLLCSKTQAPQTL